MALPYATANDLRAYVGEDTNSLPDAVAQPALDSASWDLDSMLFVSAHSSPAPGASAPGAPELAVGSAGNLNGGYIYRVTFVVGAGVSGVTTAGETQGGVAAGPIFPNNQQVNISRIPLGPAGYGVTARRVYRTVAGGSDGSQKLVTVLGDNSTTSFADNVADGSLGGAMPVANTTESRKLDASTMTPHQQDALVRACCAQAEYRIEMGNTFFVRAQYRSTGGPDFNTTGKLPLIGPKVRRELAGSGLMPTGARASAGRGQQRDRGFFGPGTPPWPKPYGGYY